MKVRLQKFMADAGISSRRNCEDIILQGRVKVNGKVVDRLGVKVDPKNDIVEVDGKRCKRDSNLVYIILNKPTGVISTVKDPFGRKKVVDLVDEIDKRVHPVGRLDQDTEGLLMLTNDGDVTYKLTHPKFEVEKTYEARVRGIVSSRVLKKLQEGIILEDGVTAPAKARLLKLGPNWSIVELVIHEGRNRQVRRMFDALKHPVTHLRRTAIGRLRLKDLKVGQWRWLTKGEINYIKNL